MSSEDSCFLIKMITIYGRVCIVEIKRVIIVQRTGCGKKHTDVRFLHYSLCDKILLKDRDKLEIHTVILTATNGK